MRSSTVRNVVLVAASIGVTLMVLELAVRVHRGAVFTLRPATAGVNAGPGRMQYDPRLGWTPRPGRFAAHWTSNVDARGIRSNGSEVSTTTRPILAVGDSFTFGDEVADDETWPAYLQGMLHKRVINAGVGAYGIDQAYLRAEALFDVHDPDFVILSFISDDINRTEFSYYPYGRGWKPYFEYENGGLVLRNVPVPRGPPPRDKDQVLRRLLSYSYLADAILKRLAYRWWRKRPAIERVHNDGESVSLDLFVRLRDLVEAQGGQFVVVALRSDGRIGGNARLSGLVERARANNVSVLDPFAEPHKIEAVRPDARYLPHGHYSPAMNRVVAESVASYLQDKGSRSRSTPPRAPR
jgi:hypothetical protein